MHTDETYRPPKALWPVFAIGLLMLLLFWLGTKALLDWSAPVPAEDAERSAERLKAYEDMTTENDARLTQFGWADREKGGVQIPIELAMRLTTERLASQTPVAAGPVNPPVPAPQAPASEPAPPADSQAEPAVRAEPATPDESPSPAPDAAAPAETAPEASP